MPCKAKVPLRMAAVKRVESGESLELVAAGLDVNRRTIYRWIEVFDYGGRCTQSQAHPGRTAQA